MPEQIGVYLMGGVPFARIGLWGNRLEPHFSHESLYPLSVHIIAHTKEILPQLSAAQKWMPGVFFVDQPHQRQVLFTLRGWQQVPIITGSSQ